MLRYVLAFAGVLTLGGVALAERIELVTGETLRGPIIAQDERAVTIAHPVLGHLVIRRADIAGIKPEAPADRPVSVLPAPPGTQHAAGLAATQPVTTSPASASPASASFAAASQPATAPLDKPVKPIRDPEGWVNKLSIGISGTRNTSESIGGNVGLKSQRTTRRDRWTFESVFFYSETDSNTTRNEFTTRTLKDWLIPDSKWFIFGQGQFDLAQLRPYNERISGSFGPGYQLLNNEKVNLRLRLGGGGYQQFGSNDDDDFHPEASFGTELEWKVTTRQTLVFANTFFADMGILGRNRNVTRGDWIIKIQDAPGLSLKFSLQNEYDSFTADDATQNDLHFTGGLQFEF